jgi:hypothetical protein
VGTQEYICRFFNSFEYSLIQIFDLSNSEKPLNDFTILEVSGRISSELNVNIKNEQLRIIYDPNSRKYDSALAILLRHTEIIKYNIAENLIEEERWKFDNYTTLKSISANNIALLS